MRKYLCSVKNNFKQSEDCKNVFGYMSNEDLAKADGNDPSRYIGQEQWLSISMARWTSEASTARLSAQTSFVSLKITRSSLEVLENFFLTAKLTKVDSAVPHMVRLMEATPSVLLQVS